MKCQTSRQSELPISPITTHQHSSDWFSYQGSQVTIGYCLSDNINDLISSGSKFYFQQNTTIKHNSNSL